MQEGITDTRLSCPLFSSKSSNSTLGCYLTPTPLCTLLPGLLSGMTVLLTANQAGSARLRKQSPWWAQLAAAHSSHLNSKSAPSPCFHSGPKSRVEEAESAARPSHPPRKGGTPHFSKQAEGDKFPSLTNDGLQTGNYSCRLLRAQPEAGQQAEILLQAEISLPPPFSGHLLPKFPWASLPRQPEGLKAGHCRCLLGLKA